MKNEPLTSDERTIYADDKFRAFVPDPMLERLWEAYQALEAELAEAHSTLEHWRPSVEAALDREQHWRAIARALEHVRRDLAMGMVQTAETVSILALQTAREAGLTWEEEKQC